MGRDGGASEWRILLIDAYDSFACNLAQLVCTSIPGSSVHIVKNDALDGKQLCELVPYFDAVVVGPGPGSPAYAEDIGVVPALWALPDALLLPVLGVCLGLQSLALAHGGELCTLRAPQHGRVAPVVHARSDLFAGVPDAALAVRYHSLHVSPGSLRPLAWTQDDVDGAVLMAARHPQKPFWAVQYHPESVCTSKGAASIVHNFGLLARDWAREHPRRRTLRPPHWFADLVQTYPLPPPVSLSLTRPALKVQTEVLNDFKLSVPQLCEYLGVSERSEEFVLLDSAAHPGRFSIIACLNAGSIRISHCIFNDFISVRSERVWQQEQLCGSSAWDYVANFMHERSAYGGTKAVPFWGGLVGYFSYEAGVETIDVRPLLEDDRAPDMNLVYAERSLVLDTLTGRIYVQSIRPDDSHWVKTTSDCLRRYAEPEAGLTNIAGRIDMPDKHSYLSRIAEAQGYLAEGQSYELCLTTQAQLHVSHPAPLPRHTRSWNLYRRLRARNPAPYATYMRLGETTLVGSSPERFLSWDRTGRCELRPIKGTVKKGPGLTRAVAEERLRTPKEAAENLMIVDLIRHDLHALAGDSVRVSQLMAIEEYETVYQLVSVIEGRVGAAAGFDVLRASLPPGSMTGAPKKRSVELLQGMEGAPRGIYSGVCGYLCAGGGGDWSVIIRSCFNTAASADERPGTHDTWTIGAGGAITTLSSPEDEWEEMVTKLGSVSCALG
ncbi:para-aminobenzoic acid synthetase [Auricularia subglabra TFB-10046 SS5]|nr:para-aminobenzoic acid synthetase [Auricularia subglabra TFB-10046 SS5]